MVGPPLFLTVDHVDLVPIPGGADDARIVYVTLTLRNYSPQYAEIAYSYVSSHLGDFDGDPAFFDEAYVHLHVPEGATPKDGPSAGITMATALLSLARNEELARPLAMTGELTLTGRVLPVGGIREKLIAAKRVGIREVLLPEANRGDYEDLPDYIRRGIKVQFVSHFSEVVAMTFKKPRAKRGKA